MLLACFIDFMREPLKLQDEDIMLDQSLKCFLNNRIDFPTQVFEHCEGKSLIIVPDIKDISVLCKI